MYKCHTNPSCIFAHMVCDGHKQCPGGDDEMDCQLICPSGCVCYGKVLLCSGAGYASLPRDMHYSIRKVDLSNNTIVFDNLTFSGFHWLGELILSHNNIEHILPYCFVYLKNLYLLDLSFNSLTVLLKHTFFGLHNIRELNLLGNNKLKVISYKSFEGLSKLDTLYLANMELESINDDNFYGLQSLTSLNVSVNKLSNIHSNSFQSLSNLQRLFISKNRIETMTKDTLDKLPSLHLLHGDKFKYCCFVRGKVAEENCLPERDAFSSCDDLMRRDILKIFLWILDLMALLCNAFVIIWRIRETMTVYSFCVFNLAIADFLMGIYMVTLASVDSYYRGVYIEHAESWQGSWLCTALGFVSSLSSEASVFTLCLISADRFYKIVFPLHGAKFGMKKARIATVFLWILAVVVAGIPLFPIKYFDGKFYSRSSVCLSLHITSETSPGWEYSWTIYHGLNFSCFLFIFVSYSYLYRVVKQSSKSTAKMTQGRPAASDITLARKLTLVVATDFICWVPINLMGKFK